MKTVFLVPREGVKVRDPATGFHLPTEGADRQINSYYNRRIADGDLIIRKGGKPKATASKKDNGAK